MDSKVRPILKIAVSQIENGFLVTTGYDVVNDKTGPSYCFNAPGELSDWIHDWAAVAQRKP